MKYISISIPETAHWHALIGKAEYIACHLLPQGIEDYLIRLFMRMECDEVNVIRKNTDKENADSTACKLQRLGDQCLMLCSFYPEASDEFGVAKDEFISMGVESYKKRASAEYGENEIIFEYLAKNFIQVSEILNCVNYFPGKSDVRQIYHTAIEGSRFIGTLNSGAENISFSSSIFHRVLN